MMLDRKEIDARFETEKNELLKFCVPDSHPTAFILGGQGASGKSLLSQKLYEMFALPFLFINGDDYRAYHPKHEKLISDNIEYYSTLTQPYSNVFTKRLIQEAIKNKFNVIIEGTMRNPSVSQNTADKFKKKRFEVNVAVIAAHPLLTELNCYLRFFNEVDLKGKGRLAN